MNKIVITYAFVAIISVGAISTLAELWGKTKPTIDVIVTKTKAGLPDISFASDNQSFAVDVENLDALKMPPEEHLKFYTKEHSLKKQDPKEVLYAIAAFYGLPRDLLLAQHLKETHGDCSVQSSRKAVGCFQFLSSTAKQFGLMGSKNGRHFDYRRSIAASGDAAARYMVWLAYVMYGEDTNLTDWDQLTHVLAAYNAGISRVMRDGEEPRIPSFYETKSYVYDIVRLANGESYFVSNGETLAKVSLKTQVSESELIQGNPHLSSPEDIYGGMILSVPDQITKESEMMVRPKMSLSEISKGTGVPIKDLMTANDLKKPQIKTGMILKIPVDKSIYTQ